MRREVLADKTIQLASVDMKTHIKRIMDNAAKMVAAAVIEV